MRLTGIGCPKRWIVRRHFVTKGVIVQLDQDVIALSV
jgi:hypothetical protein